MKIDGKEYNLKNFKNIIERNELNLTNKAMESLFDFFDKNKDNKLQEEELLQLADFFERCDNNVKKDGNIITQEIEKELNKNNALPQVTVYDVKEFVKNIDINLSAKQIANDINKQLSGFSLNRNTIKMLGEINEDNAAEVLHYYKTNYGDSLVRAILKEKSIFFEDKIDINTIKSSICKPLVIEAKSLGITSIYHSSYNKLKTPEELEDFVDNTCEKIQEYKNKKLRM